MSLSSDNVALTMPVQPANSNGGGNGGFGWGGDWMSFIVLFLIFGLFGGWGGYGGGWGGNSGNGLGSPSGQGWATRADINEGFALNGLQTGQSGILSAVTNGFHGVDNAICNLGYQLQDCCCQTQRAVDGVNYNLSTQGAATQAAIQGVRYDMATQACDTRNTIQNSTRDIIDSQNNGINAIMGKLAQMDYNGLNDKYQAALAENQSLKFQASQAAQNAFFTANQEAQTAELIRRINPMPVPAYQVPNPYAGCGCNPCGGCC